MTLPESEEKGREERRKRSEEKRRGKTGEVMRGGDNSSWERGGLLREEKVGRPRETGRTREERRRIATLLAAIAPVSPLSTDGRRKRFDRLLSGDIIESSPWPTLRKLGPHDPISTFYS